MLVNVLISSVWMAIKVLRGLLLSHLERELERGRLGCWLRVVGVEGGLR